MLFYLGTHQVDWLARACVPLFISRVRLLRLRTLPRARHRWALDSCEPEVNDEIGGIWVNLNWIKDQFREQILERFWKETLPANWQMPVKPEDFRVLSDYLKDQGRELEGEVVLELGEEHAETETAE